MIEKIYQIFKGSKGVSIDSRESMEGKIFFALKGDNFDGNNFAIQAISQGASLAVVDDTRIKNEQCILVNNVLETMQELANFHRKQFDVPIIGITGSNGKTTTKELVVAVLEQKYKVHATKGNFNNHIGVPLTLLRMPVDTEIAIIEMGANHIGEIAFLSKLAAPNYGLITNIGRAHLEGFGSFEGVKIAKSELYKYLESNGGTSFVNGTDQVLLELSPNKIVKYPEYNSFNQNGFVGIQMGKQRVQSNLIGDYNADNIKAAITIGDYFGLKPTQIGEGINSYQPDNNRSQLIKTKSNEIVLDAYNANPSSMECSIADFVSRVDKSKSNILILGAMKELGAHSAAAHLDLLKLLSELGQDFKVHTVGKEFEPYMDRFINISWHAELDDLEVFLSTNKIKSSRVLIKGSRSNRLENLLPLLQE